MSKGQQRAVLGWAVFIFAVLGVGSFFAAIWTSGDLSGRLAGTGFVSFAVAFVVGAWRDFR